MAKTPWLPLKNPVLEHRGLCAKATATMDLDFPKRVGGATPRNDWRRVRRFKRAAESEPTHALPFSKQATRVDHTAQHPGVETVFKSNREISNAKAEPGFFFVLRWGSKHHDVHIKCRESTDP